MVAGSFQNAIVLGGTSFTAAGGIDVFLSRLSGATGAAIWSKALGGTGTASGAGVAADASGYVSLAGFFQNSVNFGGVVLSAGGTEAFLTRYAP